MNCFKIISLFYQVQHNLLLRDKKSKQQKVKQVDGIQGKCLIINLITEHFGHLVD